MPGNWKCSHTPDSLGITLAHHIGKFYYLLCAAPLCQLCWEITWCRYGEGGAGEEWNGTLEIIIIYTQIRRKHVLEYPSIEFIVLRCWQAADVELLSRVGDGGGSVRVCGICTFDNLIVFSFPWAAEEKWRRSSSQSVNYTFRANFTDRFCIRITLRPTDKEEETHWQSLKGMLRSDESDKIHLPKNLQGRYLIILLKAH